MKAIGWLIIFIGIGAGIDAYHGNSPYKTLVSYLQGTGAVPQGASIPTAPAAPISTPATGGTGGLPGLEGGQTYQQWLASQGK